MEGYSAKVILYYHSGIINFSSGSYSETKMVVWNWQHRFRSLGQTTKPNYKKIWNVEGKCVSTTFIRTLLPQELDPHATRLTYTMIKKCYLLECLVS